MKKKLIHLTVGFFIAYFWISALAYADGYTRWTRYLENNKTTIEKATIISHTLAIKSLEYLILVFISNKSLINKIKSIERCDKYSWFFLSTLKRSSE